MMKFNKNPDKNIGKKLKKCKVCGTKTVPKSEYITSNGFQKRYDAMACPHCGCEILLREKL